MAHEEVVYSVDLSSIFGLDQEFHAWLKEQGEATANYAVRLFADELADYFDMFGDGIYDCLCEVKKKLDYEEEW